MLDINYILFDGYLIKKREPTFADPLPTMENKKLKNLNLNYEKPNAKLNIKNESANFIQCAVKPIHRFSVDGM